MKQVWVVHIQSESTQNYYRAFENEPTAEQIEAFQKEKYETEYGEEPDEYFEDLMGLRAVDQVELL